MHIHPAALGRSTFVSKIAQPFDGDSYERQPPVNVRLRFRSTSLSQWLQLEDSTLVPRSARGRIVELPRASNICETNRRCGIAASQE